jgi:trimeric autotransporter adhesin
MAFWRSIAMGAVAIAALAVASLATPAHAQDVKPAPPHVPAPSSPSTPAQPAPAQAAPLPANPALANPDTVTGGRLHGVVKSGNIPLPGVTVTAQNTLTSKRYSTTTDITGAWSMTIPQNGRYVIRTEFAAFAQGSGEALLNATGHDRTVDLSLVLASRAAQQQQQDAQAAGQGSGQPGSAQSFRQLAGNAPENLSLTSALSEGTETSAGATGSSGAELPSVAANSDFGGESVAISGQAGQVSAVAGVDMDQLRDQLQQYRDQNGGQNPGAGGLFGGFGGGGGGGFGGGGFGGGGRGGGGRGNFRGFNPGQPHGAIFWNGNNSAINAEPFSLRGQPQVQPANGANHFGITFMSAPYLPHLTKPSGKDTVFLTLSGQRSSSPDDFYATIPTPNQIGGNFQGLAPIYDPTTLTQFSYMGTPNVIPPGRITDAAKALLAYYPPPNISGTNVVDNYNYHLLTTAQSNSTQAGIRYLRSLGKNATQGGPFGGFGRRGNSTALQGLRQSINFNYNWSHSASDSASFIPVLGGKTASGSNSIQAGYTVGYHKVTSIFNANWNRSNSSTTNFFTNTADDPASNAGLTIPNAAPLNYGLPQITMSNLNGLTEQEPNFSISQTISFSETLSWIHGKHNMRFGGDYRRVHRDFLAGSNATGSFTFTGLFTEQFTDQNGAEEPVFGTGSALADLLLGLPQSTTINSTLAKSYLRDNVFDAYALDDWRIRPSLTINYGVRWEFFAPYTEKYNHLADVATDPADGFTSETEQQPGLSGIPNGLVYPWHKAFAPRAGLAWRVPKVKQMVVRAGFGMNYTVGEYATFANTMARQPIFDAQGNAIVNEQTNTEAVGNSASSACARTVPISCFTLANGFPAPNPIGNYALDPHYGLPYVEVWNLDIQKTLPLGIVLNVGYNGSRSNHLDITSAPRATPSSPGTDPTNLIFNYDQGLAFYKMNALTVRANKRLSKGIGLGANYQYSHAIDNASSVNGTSTAVAQNWQDLAAQEGHSALDIRQQVSGTYLYELPFGPDKFWVTTGVASHILEGFSMSGTFNFATGSWLTPTVTENNENVECGTTNGLRANIVPGASPSSGGRGFSRWFNTGAYTAPAVNSSFPCAAFGDAPRNSIEGPGVLTNNMALSKTMQLGDSRSMEMRATINNVFNTVQFTNVNTTLGTPQFGQVTSVGAMRSFQFLARFRF